MKTLFLLSAILLTGCRPATVAHPELHVGRDTNAVTNYVFKLEGAQFGNPMVWVSTNGNLTLREDYPYTISVDSNVYKIKDGRLQLERKFVAYGTNGEPVVEIIEYSDGDEQFQITAPLQDVTCHVESNSYRFKIKLYHAWLTNFNKGSK